MPARPGTIKFSSLMATGDDDSEVDDGAGDPITGEGYIVGLFAAGANGTLLELRDTDTSGDTIFIGPVGAGGNWGNGWIPYDQWIPFTNGVWIEQHTLTNGFTMAYIETKVTDGP